MSGVQDERGDDVDPASDAIHIVRTVDVSLIRRNRHFTAFFGNWSVVGGEVLAYLL